MGFGKDKRGVIIRDRSTMNVSISALAQGVVQKFGTVAVTEDFRLLKAEVHVIADALGTAEHLVVGLADSELTVAEIAEAIEANGPLDRNDRLVEERATRPVWPLALLSGNDQSLSTRYMTHKRPWTFSNAEGFTLFVYNISTGAVTATLGFVATYFGVWLS